MLAFALLLWVSFATAFQCDSKIPVTKVVLQNDPEYEKSTEQYASKTVGVVDIHPSIIVYCSSEAEVQSAITYASQCNLTVSTRSGGHSYTGASTCSAGCMQIDVSRINHVIVLPDNVVKLGPGVGLGDADQTLVKHFLSIPHGGCRSVGAGGHFQSSAWGHLAVSFGSGMDRITSFRIVLADSSAVTVSSTDANTTFFRSVLGSAPGSWGVIVEYTFKAIHDDEAVHSRFFEKNYAYTSDTFFKVLKHTQNILMEQEKRNTRDFKVLLAAGSKADETDLSVHTVTAYMVWTGIDSGKLTDELYKEFIQPYDDLGPKPFPESLDIPMPLSMIMAVSSVEFENPGYHFHFQSFHSDSWWNDTFFSLIVQEVDRRIALPDCFTSFQFLPLGLSSQWARNAGMNSLPWRDVRMYVDDWIMYKNSSQSESVRLGMTSFREATRPYWQYSDGIDRYTWMSPITTIPGATNLRDPKVQKSFFPDGNTFAKLQALKREVDPKGLFASHTTIPLD